MSAPLQNTGRWIGRWIGVELDDVSAKEKLVSGIGGGLSMTAIILITHHALGLAGAPMLIASMGASAVLLFAVPHGQLSQPWPVLAGHVGAAVIGVSCAKAIHSTEVAAACAVGITIVCMHQFKFIHPPGGATALTAVIGGPVVRSLGYGYVWEPVLLNALVIVTMAVAFNALFPWRRYPAALSHRFRPPTAVPSELTHAAILSAMRSIDSFLDITEDDVIRLHQALTAGSASPRSPQD